jgi:polysaccharide biosynthesis protein PslH
MKILQFCNKVPYPVIDGGTAAMHQLSQLMLKGEHQVKILAVCTHKSTAPDLDNYTGYRNSFQPEYIFLDTQVHFFAAFLNLFSSKSYNIERFDAKQLHSRLTEVLANEQPDVIILESLFVAPYISTIRKHSKAKIILRAHNVEHQVWERFAENEKNPIKKRYLQLLAKRLKAFEFSILNKVDGIAAISQTDFEFFRKNSSAPVEFIPFGVNEITNESIEVFNSNRLYFLGAMDWRPNREAAEWLVRHVVSHLATELKGVELTLAGTQMPEQLLALKHPQVRVMGKVDAPEKFIAAFGVLIAPLFSGGGLKIKVIEAMAQGKLVITTPIGIEGIGAIPGTHYLLCTTPTEFIQAILRCKTNQKEVQHIAKAGQNFIQNEFGLSSVSRKLSKLLG